jgi:hypothetical protein
LEERPLGAHLFLPLTECPVIRLLEPGVLRSVDNAPSATVKVSDPVRTANADDFLNLIFLEELLNWLLVADDFFSFSSCVERVPPETKGGDLMEHTEATEGLETLSLEINHRPYLQSEGTFVSFLFLFHETDSPRT